MQGLIQGKMVHYVLPDGHSAGEHRPAVIVKVWDQGNGCSNLTVFPDWTNDGYKFSVGLFWATSVVRSDEHHPGTWHFIEEEV